MNIKRDLSISVCIILYRKNLVTLSHDGKVVKTALRCYNINIIHRNKKKYLKGKSFVFGGKMGIRDFCGKQIFF